MMTVSSFYLTFITKQVISDLSSQCITLKFRLKIHPKAIYSLRMFNQYRLSDIPPLLVATATTFGGLWPFWAPRDAMLEFGLPKRIADNPLTHSVMAISSARTSALGLLIFIFYSQGRFSEVDTVLCVMGFCLGAADGYICWKEAVPRRGLFRATMGLVIAGWGLAGWTSRDD